jgi:hypothetical protein
MKVTRLSAIAAAIAATVATVAAISAVSVSARAPASTAAELAAHPRRFTHPQQNRYFPLRAGTVSIYRGTDEGEKLRERVVVTHRTRLIQGVTTTVVSDVLRRADGSPAEKTRDWYAPDNSGNVWYFGESTATYDRRGHVDSREGSWEAGVDGAVAGTIMPAHPRPTDAYRQEFYRGQAEDQAWVVQRHASTTVPYGALHHLVRSFEWTRLEKRVLSLKLYAPGVGIVREKDMSGGHESFVLVAVRHRR